MGTEQINKFVAAGCAAVAIVALSGCSTGQLSSASEATSPAMKTGISVSPVATSEMVSAPASLIGPGCADYAAMNPNGPASVEGMAAAPVATAAGNNPLLSTLAAALSGKLNPDVNLVDTLNNGQFTVFAPTNAAFDKLPAATLDTLKTDSAMLTSILTFHVVAGQAGPAQIGGTHKTLQGADVTVTGQGNDLKFNGAGLVCGGVQTANATVYMIDTVLTPPAS